MSGRVPITTSVYEGSKSPAHVGNCVCLEIAYELAGERDGLVEVLYRENIFAGLDCQIGERGKRYRSVELVQFLLVLVDRENGQDLVARGTLGEVIVHKARLVVGNVIDQLSEEGDFEQLVECFAAMSAAC